MKKSYLLIAIIMIASFMLGACAPQATEAPPVDETEVEETEEVQEPEETEAPEETEVPEETEEPEDMPTILIWADETRSPIVENIVGPYAEELGIQIEVAQLGFGDVRDQMKVAGPAGEGPDIFIGAHDWLGEMVANGLVAEVDLGEKQGSFFGPALDAFTYDGTLLGMPYATENIAFFCNPDLLAEHADGNRPATWDEVNELAGTIEESSGGDATAWTIQTNDPYHLFPLMSAYGGYIFGVTEEGYDPTDVGLDSEGSLAAAQWLENMAEAGYVEAGVDYDTMHALFEQGQVACIGTGPWALGRIRESGVAYNIGAFPAGDDTNGRPFLGVQGFMISAFSENVLLAQTLLSEVFASDEFMQAVYDADPRPSAWMPVREATDDADLAAFAEAGSEGLPMPAIPEMSAVWTAWGDAQELVISGSEPGVDAFENAAEQVRNQIAEGE